jgi:N-acetyl-beta-hexosaminidase
MHEKSFNQDFSQIEKLLFFFDSVEPAVFLIFPKLEQTKDANKAHVLYRFIDSLGNEAYEITVSEKNILINYGSSAGAFYATLTLKQMVNQEAHKLSCCYINDQPDLKVRGFMLDISRDKVPTVKTIKQIIDMLSQLKMNHFELYVEGFSFGYPSFEKYLAEDGFISVLEYQEVERYALERFIDLVPNQNGFGHMAKWLQEEEFKDLAEKPDGIFYGDVIVNQEHLIHWTPNR